MKRAIYHPLARNEFDQAVRYLENERPGAGFRFRGEAVAAIESALKKPDGGRPTLAGCRLIEVRRFRYRIIYRAETYGIRVFAFAHNRRRTGYWTTRVD